MTLQPSWRAARAWWAILPVLLAITSLAQGSSHPKEFNYVLWHCPTDITLNSVDAAERCQLTERPIASGQRFDNANQLMRIEIINPTAQTQTAQLFIGPYYLPDLSILNLDDPSAPIAQGGAFAGGSHSAASLGGHIFTLELSPGANQRLIAIRAPGFAHISIQVNSIDASGLTPNGRILNIGVHLGMLAALTGLALVGWFLRPNVVNSRLLLLTGLIAIQVALGTGFASLLMPSVSGLALMMAFSVLIMLRTAAWGWLYQSLIEPHYSQRWYQWGCGLSYSLSIVAIAFYLMNWLVAARILSLALILMIPLLHTVAALRVRTFVPLLKPALVGSLVIYDALQIIALVLLTVNAGMSDLPIVISRILDIAVPLLAMAAVLLRNRGSDQQLASTEQDLARREASLAAETAARNDKHALIHMLTEEVRDPLAGIQTASRELLDPSIKNMATVQQTVRRINVSARTINEIIERCDLHNRLEDEGITPNLRNIDCQHLLKELITRFDLHGRVKLTGPPLTWVNSDIQLLDKLFGNLLDNARQYARPNSLIEVSVFDELQQSDYGQAPATHRPSWGVKISHEIDPETAPDGDQIFNQHYQAHSANQGGGSGLGLSLARQIAQVLNGQLSYHATNDHVTFTLEVQHC